ncbi:MAG: hypothetical protein ABJN65_08905 [Parasphingorhabdus sp.]
MIRDWRALVAIISLTTSALLMVYYIKAITDLIHLGEKLQAAKYGWIKPPQCTDIPEGMAISFSLDSGCIGYVPEWSVYLALGLFVLGLGVLICMWWSPNR